MEAGLLPRSRPKAYTIVILVERAVVTPGIPEIELIVMATDLLPLNATLHVRWVDSVAALVCYPPCSLKDEEPCEEKFAAAVLKEAVCSMYLAMRNKERWAFFREGRL
jgi:hypothetical protein